MSIIESPARKWPIRWIVLAALVVAGFAAIIRSGVPSDETSDSATRSAADRDGVGTDVAAAGTAGARDADGTREVIARRNADGSGGSSDGGSDAGADGSGAVGGTPEPGASSRGIVPSGSSGSNGSSGAADPNALPQADYHRGVELAELGRATEAAAAFARYAAAVPVLADFAHRAAGDALLDADLTAEAADAYALALAARAPVSSAVLSAIWLGNARLRLDDPEGAIQAYADAEGRAEIDDERAQALAGMVAAHLDAGREAEANAVRLRLVRELPGTTTARASFERLREAGVTIALEESAAVLAAAGEHAAALAAMQAAIDSRTADGGSAPPEWHLRALQSERALGAFDALHARADDLISSGAAGGLVAEVALLRARTLEDESRPGEAATAFLELADAYPGTPEAAEALWRRATLVESHDGELAGADAHALFAARYPADSRAPDAMFRAGWLKWRAGRLDDAARAWAALSGTANAPPSQRARAEYWLGRFAAEREGPVAADARWRAAIAYNREAFHALLAAERLGEKPVPPPPAGSGDAAEAIGRWLATWSAGDEPQAVEQALSDVRERFDIARGTALLALGEDRAARRALRAGIREIGPDPARMAALAIHADAIGLPDIAIAAAAETLRLAPESAGSAAPTALRRLIYPLGDAELIRSQSRAHGLPPSLMFALVWQESRFDPGAISSAGARGLTQVMPATGADIAGRLGDVGYDPEQLHQPHISARYGAWYLSEQLKRLADDQRVALAAYNGGPGNARRWLESSGGDLDDFVEIIHLSETRRYLPAVITARAWYELLDPADARR